MTRLTRKTRTPLPLLLALVTLASACDPTEPETPSDPPATTFSVAGQLTPAADGAAPAHVRLALAWYPELLAGEETRVGTAAPPVLVAGDAAYRGDIAQGFHFTVANVPPAAALGTLGDGLVGRGAFGLLLAYEDRNGNGRLDPIPADGAPVDRVLGSSLLQSADHAFAVLYVEEAQAASTGLKRGLNLLQGEAGAVAGAVRPPSTRVTLQLTAGSPMHDAMVCEAGWLTFLFQPVCGLESPDFQRALDVGGRVALTDAGLQVELEVEDEGTKRSDARVTLDGQALAWDAEAGRYVLPAASTLQLAPGATFHLAVKAGEKTVAHLLRLPGDFAITAPGAQVSMGAPRFTLAWEPSEAATSYYVGYTQDAAMEGTWVQAPEHSVSFESSTVRGEGRVTVEARIDPTEASALVTTALVRSQAVHFVD